MLTMNGMANAWRAAGLALGMTLGGAAAVSMPGCELDTRAISGVPAVGGDGGMGGDGGIGGDGGAGGDGGGASLPVGPSLLRPVTGQILPASRAYLLWQDGEVPAGRTVTGYELCSTTGTASGINDAAECPNSTPISENHYLVDPFALGVTLFWKVRARFDDGTFSSYSDVRSAVAADLIRARYLLNGNASDSAAGLNGILENGAGFGSGLVDQALSLDGTDDFVSVADDPAFNFGAADFAISLWLNPFSTGTSQALVDKRDGGSLYEFYRRTDGSLSFTATGCTAVAGGAVPAGSWRHGVVTRTAGTLRLYVNGVQVGMSACAGDLSNAGALAIGCLSPSVSCTEPFAGSMDEVMVLGGGAITPEIVINEYCSALAASGADPLPPECQP